MKLQKTLLLDAMKNCLPGVEKSNSMIEGADTFVFGNGAIHSYNDGISVSATANIGDLSGAVKSIDFYKLINKLPQEEIEITPVEGKWKISTEKIEAEITLINSKISDYIAELEIDKLDWNDLPENFFEALRLVNISGNHSIQRGVFVKDNEMISTDTVRINHHKLSSDMSMFWLDDPAVVELLKLKDITQYTIQSAWVHFKNDSGVIFSCKRKADGQFPYDVLKKHIDNHQKIDSDIVYKIPPSITDAVDRVSVLAGTIRDHLAIKLVIQKDGFTIESSKESGKIKEKVLFDSPIEAIEATDRIEMWVEPSFILEATKKVTGFFIKQHEAGESVQKNIVFFNDNYTQVVATYIH